MDLRKKDVRLFVEPALAKDVPIPNIESRFAQDWSWPADESR